MVSRESTGQSLHLFSDTGDAIDAAVHDLTAAAEHAVRQRGRAVFALGTSPGCSQLYRRWSELARERALWSYLLIFEADQQVDACNRDVAAIDVPGLHVVLPVSHANAFHIPCTDSADDDATGFERTLRMALELRPEQRPFFDRVVLELDASGSCAGNAPADWTPDMAPRLAHAATSGGGRIGLTTSILASTRKLVLRPTVGDGAGLVRRWTDPADPILLPMRRALALRGTSVALYAEAPPTS